MQIFDKAVYKNINKTVNGFINSYWYIVLIGAVTLISHLWGLDLLAYYFISLSFAYVMLFDDDFKPAMAAIFFIPFVSNPTNGNIAYGGYYVKTAVLVQCIILIVIMVSAYIIRVIKRREFKSMLNKNMLTSGFIILLLATILNGIFSSYYKPLNIIMAIGFVVVIFWGYCYVMNNMKPTKNMLKYLSIVFTILGVVIAVQLCGLYLSSPELMSSMDKGLIDLGWGISNSIGYILLLCLPFPFYIIFKSENRLWTIGFFALMLIISLALILTFARGALIAAIPALAACLIICVLKAKFRITFFIMTAAFLAALLIFLILQFDFLISKLNFYIETGIDDRGRIELWKEGFEVFKKSWLFGVGFNYRTNLPQQLPAYAVGFHNTFLQYLYVCGIVGLLAYMFHIYQLVKMFFVRFTVDKIFFIIAILALMGGGLFGNNMFNFYLLLMLGFIYGFIEAGDCCRGQRL